MRSMNLKFLLLLALGTLALAIPSVASATPKVVILRDDVSPQAKLAQYNISATYIYTNALHGFAADLDPLTSDMLAVDSEVVMIADDRKHSFASVRYTGFRYTGFRYTGYRYTGYADDPGAPVSAATSGATPIENIPQLAARGLRRVGGLSSKTAKIDNVDQRVDADIAIIDSGVQPDQPDLNVVGGADCTGGNTYSDVEGHGTIVAGILGAKDNAFGIVGVAPGARIWSVRVLDDTLSGEDSAVLCAVDWVTQHSGTIDVANMSLGSSGSDDGRCGQRNGDVIHYAICKSVRKGVVYVAAAGNDGVKVNNSIPAAYNEVIAVSAMADSDGLKGGKGGPEPCEGFADDTFAPFSNWGSRIDLAAPGVCIASTYMGSDVAVDSGTSYAAPFVTGAAALYLASDQGRKEMKKVSASDRAAFVRDQLIDERERTSLPGDPDRDNEGIVNVKSL